MKTPFYRFLFALVILFSLTACQPTPDKGDSTLKKDQLKEELKEKEAEIQEGDCPDCFKEALEKLHEAKQLGISEESAEELRQEEQKKLDKLDEKLDEIEAEMDRLSNDEDKGHLPGDEEFPEEDELTVGEANAKALYLKKLAQQHADGEIDSEELEKKTKEVEEMSREEIRDIQEDLLDELRDKFNEVNKEAKEVEKEVKKLEDFIKEVQDKIKKALDEMDELLDKAEECDGKCGDEEKEEKDEESEEPEGSKPKIQAILHGDSAIPVDQLHTFADEPGGECDGEEHWHPNEPSVLSVDGQRFSDPDSGGCGFGKVSEVEVVEVEMEL